MFKVKNKNNCNNLRLKSKKTQVCKEIARLFLKKKIIKLSRRPPHLKTTGPTLESKGMSMIFQKKGK